MCGRFGLIASGKQVAMTFGVTRAVEILPRYNIAPTQPAWILHSAGEGASRMLAQRNWGLIPAWASKSRGRPLINARAETVAQKPSFRDAYKHRRCVVPADGWYEWQATATGKQPYALRPRDEPLFAMAGIWEGETFAILTRPAAASIAWLHERMPVLVPHDQMDSWLMGEAEPTMEVDAAFEVWPVDRAVNRVSTDGPVCREPIDLPSVERQLPLL